MRIVLIGCGYITQVAHGPAFARLAAENPSLELAACCDAGLARAEAACAAFGFRRAYSDYQRMLQAERPDAVALMVPVKITAEMSQSILQAGYPLLVEKPPAMSVSELDNLIQAAAASRAVHQVAFNRRFAPLVTELKRLLQGQPILHVEHIFTRVQRKDADFTTTAIHGIDTLRWLLDSDYRSLEFCYRKILDGSDAVTLFSANGQFDNGAGLSMLFHPLAGVPTERTVIYTPHNTYEMRLNHGPDAPGSLTHWCDGSLVKEVDAAVLCGSPEDFLLDGFYAEDAAFVQAVQSGERNTRHDFQSARQSVEIMQLLRERSTRYSIITH